MNYKEKSQLDTDWQLQGRIIPPSCTRGDGCILHLQARFHSWIEDHFHVGRVPISSEAGVELALSILLPIEDELLRDSWEAAEKEEDIDYLSMAKLIQPDTIAFATVTGMTVVIHSQGISALFAPSEKCKHCKGKEGLDNKMIQNIMNAEDFDSLMHFEEDEKSH